MSHSFKVGDRVLILRSVPDCKQGWPEDMNEYVGQEAEVTQLIDTPLHIGYRLDIDSQRWNWPEKALYLYPVAIKAPGYAFQIGDRVHITRRIEKEAGWDNSWTEDMNDYIGQMATVTGCLNGRSKYGVTLDIDEGTYGWPASALTLITSAPIAFTPEVTTPLPQLPNQGLW